MLDSYPLSDARPSVPDEFSIYLNYVRKLGFEETPDYDFLRELFAKVMKSNGDIDDQVYDWNLLNGISPCFSRCRRRVLIADLQEGKDGSLRRARIIKPCNRYRTPSRREDPTFPCRVARFLRPPPLSATDPRRANLQATCSCRTTARAVLDSSPLSPALPRSTFRSHQTSTRVNRTVTISETSRTLVIKRTTGRHRWYRRSRTRRCRLVQADRLVYRTGRSRSRKRTSRQSLAFGRSLCASVRDTPPLSYHLCPFPSGFLVIYHITNILHVLSPHCIYPPPLRICFRSLFRPPFPMVLLA
jgi:hypothetical protein